MAERYTVVRDFDSNYAVFDKSIQMSIATFTTAEEASKYAQQKGSDLYAKLDY